MKVVKLVFCILLFIFSVNAYAQETIVLGNGEWAPFLGKDLKHYGLASHVVTEVFNSLNIKTEYKWYGDSWKRCYKDATTGKTNGSLCWSKNSDREKEMYFSDNIIPKKKNVFFYLKKNNFDWKSVKDLKGKKIGGTLGYTYGAMIIKAEKEGVLKLDRIAKEPQNLKKLLKGRIDLFLAMEDIVTELIKKLPPDDAAKITFHPTPVTEIAYHLILDRNNPKNLGFMKKFEGGLKKLKDSGKWDQFIQDSKEGKYN